MKKILRKPVKNKKKGNVVLYESGGGGMCMVFACNTTNYFCGPIIRCY